jgi:hypothetical protein
MFEVTERQFFDALKREEAKGKDIMPRIVNSTHPYTSEWVQHKLPSRPVFGRTEGHPTKFFLKEA